MTLLFREENKRKVEMDMNVNLKLCMPLASLVTLANKFPVWQGTSGWVVRHFQHRDLTHTPYLSNFSSPTLILQFCLPFKNMTGWDILRYTWSVLLRTDEVMLNKERLRSSPRLEETKETWKLQAMLDLDWILGQKEDSWRNLNKVCRLVNSIISMLSSKIVLGCQSVKVIKKTIITQKTMIKCTSSRKRKKRLEFRSWSYSQITHFKIIHVSVWFINSKWFKFHSSQI